LVAGTIFPARHPRIRDALDMASATVLVAAIVAVVIGCVVFWPRILEGKSTKQRQRFRCR
jgi:diacylglycerol kinase